ncbi:SGT1 and CS domain containing protein [Apiospora phragmitis]|uniref:SGT1 and CS domain containing protein n=1 Tax=Apiospora phragmitis TaxID=2905665 RepID=A0ABR1T2X8_9PEZI
MSSKLANDGIDLVKAGKYAEGIEKITQALKDHPAPLWLLERSKAYLRTQELDLALYDAEKALAIAFKRANRPLMTEAQLRRAITLYRLGRFADADVCATWTANLIKGARATEDDGQQNKVDENGDYVVTSKDVTEENKVSKEDGMATAMGGGGNTKEKSLQNQAYTWRIQALNAMEKTTAGSSGRKVTVVKYPTPSDTPPAKTAKKAPEAPKKTETPPAAQQRPAAKPSTECAPVKTTAPAPAKPIAQHPEPVASGSVATKSSSGSAYPTSSKSGPKNWDLIAAEADEEDDTTKNDANAFFQKLYNGADPDSQRAMMKSFVESNGTALSTSWADASQKNYQTQPPDGMESKKWD